ncbi:hypothetical protein RBI14_08930 [Alcaligenaceae bacterium B3P038]|nr:hypothetical protein [Alcaligenaceae bacterium B3P038]
MLTPDQAVDSFRSKFKIGQPITGWLYIGAGSGATFEIDDYSDVPYILALESDEALYAKLQRRFTKFKRWECGRSSLPSQPIIAADTDASTKLSIEEIFSVFLPAKTASKDATALAVRQARFDWLTISSVYSISELSGLMDALSQFNVIELRVRNFTCPEIHAATSNEAVELLQRYGFILRGTVESRDPDYSHLFFCRDWPKLIEIMEDRLAIAEIESNASRSIMEAAKQDLSEHSEKSAVEVSRYRKDIGALSKRIVDLEHSLAEFKALAPEFDALQSAIDGLRCDVTAEHDRVSRLFLDGFAEINERLKLDNRLQHTAKDAFVEGRDQLASARRHIERHVSGTVKNAMKQLEAYIAISSYWNDGKLIPPMHEWAISPDFARYLIDLIESHDYDLIIEFGSGVSTSVVERTIKSKLERSRLQRMTAHIAFEHNEHYFHKTCSLLNNEASGDESTRLSLVDLTSYTASDGSTYEFYSCETELKTLALKFSAFAPKILVVVDGPPAATGPHARYPALPIVVENFPVGDIDFLLDDYSRADEQETVEKWKTYSSTKGITMQIEAIEMEKNACLVRLGR